MSSRHAPARAVRVAVGGALVTAACLTLAGPAHADPAPPVAPAKRPAPGHAVGLTGRTPLTGSSQLSDAARRHREAVIRARFGLESDDAYLDRVAHAPDSTSVELGVPLTPSESADVARRGALDAWAAAVLDEGKASPYFSGVEVDRAAGGVIDVRLVDSTRSDPGSLALRASLLGLLPATVRSEVSYVPYSFDALQAAYDSFGEDLTRGKLKTYRIACAGLEGDRLTITVATDAPAGAEEALRARYDAPFLRVLRGPGVEFQ